MTCASAPVTHHSQCSGRSIRAFGLLRLVGTTAVAAVFMASAAIAQSAPDNLEALRQESLDLVNAARAEENLSPLKFEAELNEAAQMHAEDMLERNFYAHVSPDGDTVMDRYTAAGGSEYRLVAENIAQCRGCSVPAYEAAVQDLHEGWMNSPEHRENILADDLTGYGFGLAEDSSGTRYSVQTFAGPGTPRGTEADATAEPIDPVAQSELAASLINERREADGASSLSVDQRLIEAARHVIPDGDLSEFSLDELHSLQSAIPPEAPWSTYQMIVGSCGGCGVTATDADVKFFIEQWFNDQSYRETLTDPQLSFIGLSIEPDGRGRK